MSVIVIGAGLAGLTAAYELKKLGRQAIVLEARSRVGGRVWSTRLANGEIIELGGEWIEAHDEALHRLAAELGLKLIPIGVDFMARQVVNGPPVSPAEQTAMHHRAATALAQLDETALATMTVAEFLNRLDLSEAQRALLAARLQGSWGAELDRVALQGLAGGFAFEGTTTYFRVANGNQSLAEALAKAVGAVRLEHEVTAINHTAHTILIHGRAAGAEFTLPAAAVVLAVPVAVLRRIRFEPALPDRVRAAIQAIPMGVAAKLAVATTSRPSLRAVQDVSVPYWSWTGCGEAGRPRLALTAFAGSEPVQRKLATTTGDPAVWLTHLQAAHPDLTLSGEARLVNWGLDRLAQGCYSAFDQQAYKHYHHLAEPAGRFVFAGEHTNGSGTMNGAIESGFRAAEQVWQIG